MGPPLEAAERAVVVLDEPQLHYAGEVLGFVGRQVMAPGDVLDDFVDQREQVDQVLTQRHGGVIVAWLLRLPPKPHDDVVLGLGDGLD